MACVNSQKKWEIDTTQRPSLDGVCGANCKHRICRYSIMLAAFALRATARQARNHSMHWLALLLGLFPLAQQAAAQAVPPPSNGVSESAPAVPAQPFDEWLQSLIEEARARGFSNEIVDATLKGLEPLPRVIERDRSQAELRPGFGRYSASHLTRTMVTRGRDLSNEFAAILQK